MSAALPTTTLTKRRRFLNAIHGEAVDRPPVWLMRQAGRYLPQYRAVKENHDFHTLCTNPEVAVEVSMQPLEILDVDALIIFNDILIPLQEMGREVVFQSGGPIVTPPFRHESELAQLRPPAFAETPPVFETISALRRAAGEDVPILGFAGAPFTMATYFVEGQMSKNLRHIKELLYARPEVLERILEILAQTLIRYLQIQIKAGADAVQIFDSWAGALSIEDYKRFALPYQKTVIDAIQSAGTPVTLYVNGSAHVIQLMKQSGAKVLSVDWRRSLNESAQCVGDECTLQGNLDPCALYAPPEAVVRHTRAMLSNINRTHRYIANLGHGVLPETPVESVKAFVETVKES